MQSPEVQWSEVKINPSPNLIPSQNPDPNPLTLSPNSNPNPYP